MVGARTKQGCEGEENSMASEKDPETTPLLMSNIALWNIIHTYKSNNLIVLRNIFINLKAKVFW